MTFSYFRLIPAVEAKFESFSGHGSFDKRLLAGHLSHIMPFRFYEDPYHTEMCVRLQKKLRSKGEVLSFQNIF